MHERTGGKVYISQQLYICMGGGNFNPALRL